MREDIAGPQGASSRPMWETLEGMVREKAQEFIQQIMEEEVTELLDRPLRRRFSPSYKLRIVEEADRCTEPGEVGQLLRREGLYSSHLTTWRKAAHSGSLKALSKKRGRKPERNPLDEKVRKLERRNARLENELRKAHLIIDVQGKVAGLLGISLDDGTNS